MDGKADYYNDDNFRNLLTTVLQFFKFWKHFEYSIKILICFLTKKCENGLSEIHKILFLN